MKPNWIEPFPGHRVIGPLYAVGTAGLGVFLVASSNGHVLINTGWKNSAQMIHANLEALGFHLEDVRLLLTMQSHDDHCTDLAQIKDSVGAEMWAMESDIRVLEDGGMSDPHFGGRELFPPVRVDEALRHGDEVPVGDIGLTVHEHPGHTEGSCSYTMTVDEDGTTYDVAIVNMATINKGKRLVVDPTYPGVERDFAITFERQKALKADIWVSAHAAHYSRDDKYAPGQPYDPEAFLDPQGLTRKVEQLEQIYLAQVEHERQQVDPRPMPTHTSELPLTPTPSP